MAELLPFTVVETKSVLDLHLVLPDFSQDLVDMCLETVTTSAIAPPVASPAALVHIKRVSSAGSEDNIAAAVAAESDSSTTSTTANTSVASTPALTRTTTEVLVETDDAVGGNAEFEADVGVKVEGVSEAEVTFIDAVMMCGTLGFNVAALTVSLGAQLTAHLASDAYAASRAALRRWVC